MTLVLVESPLGYFLLEKENDEYKIRRSHKFTDINSAQHHYSLLNEGSISNEVKALIKSDKIFVADERLLTHIENASLNIEEYRNAKSYLVSKLPRDEYLQSLLAIAHKEGARICPIEQGDLLVAESLELLDELDKDINMNVMRLREWYSFHFPELSDMISDGKEFAEKVELVGMRKEFLLKKEKEECTDVDNNILEAAKMSMGTEISEVDSEQMKADSRSIIAMYQQREELYTFIINKLNIVCPNLIALVGEIVAARLISKAGSLLNLSRYPAGTIQLMGAEKAFCAALKNKSDTPKYGFIYNSPLIGQVAAHLKGKFARTLAAKAALAIKVDCFGSGSSAMGKETRKRLEQRIKDISVSKKKRK